MKLMGKAKMLRIHIGEDDEWKGSPLHEAIVGKCRELDIAGATVYRGILGYGANSRIHRKKVFALSEDLPLMIAIIDTEEKIAELLPALDEMVGEGMVALSDVEVIKYVHGKGK
jgi:PII-like signaling protein